jgi:hypothetical protein
MAYSSTLKMEALRSYETSLDFGRATRRCISIHSALHSCSLTGMCEDEDEWGREGIAPHILFVWALYEVCGQLNAAAVLLSGEDPSVPFGSEA